MTVSPKRGTGPATSSGATGSSRSCADRHGAKPEVALEHLIVAVKQFSEGAAQADDVTVLVLRYRGTRPAIGGRMQIGQRMAGDVAIVEITGDITLSKGGDVIIKDKIQSLLQQGNRKLLLDLGNVSYVDSAGLGQLVQVYATTQPPRRVS